MERDLGGETDVQLSGSRPLSLDVGPRPSSEAEIGIQRLGPAMEHQPTRGGGKRVPLGSTTLKEDAMSVMVGIDVGAYKHAAAVHSARRAGSGEEGSAL